MQTGPIGHWPRRPPRPQLAGSAQRPRGAACPRASDFRNYGVPGRWS
eukprot:COSAG04_NODE_24579_length_319_cov_1.631818_1_plen_46_part_10